MKTLRLLFVLLACLLTLAEAAAAPSQASSVLGMTVVDTRNKRLGVVTDLVVDLEKAQITGLQVGHATADGMAHDVYPWSAVQLRSDKVVASGPGMPGEAAGMQSVAKMIHGQLKDAEGKSAGQISDVMVSLPDAKVANFIVQFDPKWLDMTAPAALPLSTIDWKGDGGLVKFSALDVRPAGSDKPVAAPPPPPVLQRARLSQLGSDGFAKAPANEAAARRLLGARLINPSGDPVGKVEDVIVDTANGTPEFVIASFNPDWVAPGWFVVLPVRPLQAGKDGIQGLRVQLNTINEAFIFNASTWPDFTNAAFNAGLHAKLDKLL
jgi:sporulation protein YlmC with PRC-barrel domain